MPRSAAIYARVSSEQQANARTIESQIEELLQRAAADEIKISKEHQYIDDGYSGASLLRPALERLRDTVSSGTVSRLYIHSPDRLSRKYVYQILLIDEFKRAGVEVCFLNQQRGDTLLLQIQGIIAEYERTKILERSRRGRLHAARRGAVSVMGAAPYGYHYIAKKHSPDGQARFEINDEEAEVVRQIFKWVAEERTPLSEICRRLRSAEIKTHTGSSWWSTKTILGMLP
jgi:site-specific DNA recombinase